MLGSLLKCPPSPLWRLKRSLVHPGDSQRKLLFMLVRKAHDTVWGREHGYGEFRTSAGVTEEYQSRVPLSHYSDVQPYLDRVINGEPNVIWPGHPTAFAVSGGTRSGGRVVPLSREALAFLTKSSLLPGLCYLARCPGASSILRGKILSLPGGIEAGPIAGGKVAGEVSGLLAHHAPRLLAHWLQALPRRVLLMEDWDTKLTEAARLSVCKDVRSLIMVPSWAPAFLECVRDVVGAATVAEAVGKVWPNLRVFFAGGVALSSYQTILRAYLGRHVALIESYSASEGLFAFQDGDEKDGLLLNLNGGVFFEFVRRGDHNEGTPTRHTIETVDPGVDYVMYVTNASGLWSVCVDDIVRFVTASPPRLRVVGRVGEMLDRFGDATGVEHARHVITATDAASGARCLNYHLTYADESDSPAPRHLWVLEFELESADMQSYVRRLDAFMGQFNGRYRTRRVPGAMASPVVTTVPPGSFAEYLRVARSRLSGQSKIIHVSEDIDISQGIIAAARRIDASRISTIRVD